DRGRWTAGLFAILGVGMCLLASVTLLPAFLQVFVVARRDLASTREDRRQALLGASPGDERVSG
ncbi:MAG: hypothetical protein ACE5ID_09310, partial [Acidobacteriota bacterium]